MYVVYWNIFFHFSRKCMLLQIWSLYFKRKNIRFHSSLILIYFRIIRCLWKFNEQFTPFSFLNISKKYSTFTHLSSKTIKKIYVRFLIATFSWEKKHASITLFQINWIALFFLNCDSCYLKKIKINLALVVKRNISLL